MTEHPKPRTRLLAATIIALALLVGGLAGATIDRTVFRRAAHATHPAEMVRVTGDPASYSDDPAAEGGRVPDRQRVRALGGRGPGMSMRPGERPGPGPGMRPGARYLDQLARELDLSAEQRARIEELLRDQQERMREVRQEQRQRGNAVIAETRSRIFEILTPEQRATMQHGGRVNDLFRR